MNYTKEGRVLASDFYDNFYCQWPAPGEFFVDATPFIVLAGGTLNISKKDCTVSVSSKEFVGIAELANECLSICRSFPEKTPLEILTKARMILDFKRFLRIDSAISYCVATEFQVDIDDALVILCLYKNVACTIEEISLCLSKDSSDLDASLVLLRAKNIIELSGEEN